MRRIPTLAAMLSLALASAAAAQETAATTGKVTVVERGGIEATGEVVFQDLLLSPDMPLGPRITTTSTSGASVSMSDGVAVSLDIPESFDLALANGEWTLTVTTAVNGGQVGVLGMQSLVSPGGTLSVDVSGEISARPQDLAPGEYRGLLVVVAQYN